jgi:predicted phosphohydrolase
MPSEAAWALKLCGANQDLKFIQNVPKRTRASTAD